MVIQKVGTEQADVHITVAVGTPLQLRNFAGTAEIGDVKGPLRLTTSGNVRIGEITRASVYVQRSGRVQIAKVTEQLELDVTGNAEAKIASGDVEHLNVYVANNGEATFGGRAEQASLSATDNGEMSIARVVHPPTTRVARNGSIRVENW